MTKSKNLIRDLSESEMRGICGGHPTEQDPFGSEPLLKEAIPALRENGAFDTAQPGFFQGFVVHAPTCAGHPGLSH